MFVFLSWHLHSDWVLWEVCQRVKIPILNFLLHRHENDVEIDLEFHGAAKKVVHSHPRYRLQFCSFVAG